MNATLDARPLGRAGMAGSQRRAREVLLVENGRWPLIIYAAIASAVLAYPLFGSLTPWLTVGIFAIALILGHLGAVVYRMPWLPGVILLISALQWILAPALVFLLPDAPTIIPISVSARTYFDFAIPGFLCFAAGLYAPLLSFTRRRNLSAEAVQPMRPATRARLIDVSKQMAIAGLVAHAMSYVGLPSAVRFVAEIMGRLTLVGALSLLLLGAPRWRMWCLIAIATQLFDSVVSSLFNGTFILTLHMGLLMTYRRRVPLRRIVMLSVGAVVVFLTVNGFKGAYRATISDDVGAGERISLASSQFWSFFTDPDRVFAPQNISFNLSRLNQGSITARVLYWTPQYEPFARGETVAAAVRAAVLPRFLDASKVSAGGGDNYPRFTGLPLLHGTSINLSALGEFYANYGTVGGWIAVFVWGVFLSTVFFAIASRARRDPVWWAWVPFVMPSSVSAESGLVELLNEIFKSGLVMIALVWTIPAWRMLIRERAAARTRRTAR